MVERLGGFITAEIRRGGDTGVMPLHEYRGESPDSRCSLTGRVGLEGNVR